MGDQPAGLSCVSKTVSGQEVLLKKILIGSTVLAAMLAVVSLGMLIAQSSSGDYLPPELRAQVNQLKRDAETQATNAQNVADRGVLLWQWINAYSLTGGPLPVNATQDLGGAFVLEDAKQLGSPPATAVNMNRLVTAVDELIYEFRIKDEHPKAIPVITASSGGPFAASSFTTLTQTVTIGEMPMRIGGVFMLARTLQNDGGPPQVDDPAADNYVTVRSSNPRARFVKHPVPWVGMHGGFRGAQPNAGFQLGGEALQPGDQVMFTYGDRSGGSRGLRMPTFSNDKLLHPIYIDLEANGKFLTPEWPRFNVIGNQTASVRATAPSIVTPGERFELAVRSEDDHYNRATGPIPGYEISLNGTSVRTVPAGTEGLTVVRDVHIDQPGTYRIEVRSADGKFTTQSNPVWVEQNPAQRIYWGETHAHSGFSEGMGTIDGFYKWGREDAWLDFGGLSEHDIWLDDSEWKAMNDAVRKYTDSRFIAFLAYEWTVNRQYGGHHNVWFRTPGHSRVPAQMNYTLSRLYQGLRTKYLTKDVMVIPHAHQAADWRYSDPDLEHVVEIASTHGDFEWFGNYYLQHGAEVGFIGASDDHRTRPGYSPASEGELQTMNAIMAVRAKQKTANDIFDAMLERATYATSDAKRILVDFRVNHEMPGRRAAYSAQRRIHARVSGTGPLDKFEIIKNGEVIYTQRFAEAEFKPASRVEVGFYSDSEPYIRDNPRGYRTWKGYVDIQGAQVASLRSYFNNPTASFVRQDANNPSRLQFRDESRGRTEPFVLELTGMTPSTRLVFHLDQTVEQGVAPPAVRPAATIPGGVVELPFNEFGALNGGIVKKELHVDRYTDSITARLVNLAAPMDGELDYADMSNPQPGDYYYLRVTQLDGARAWSSPIWVGGESPR
jgi:hypothetical protein